MFITLLAKTGHRKINCKQVFISKQVLLIVLITPLKHLVCLRNSTRTHLRNYDEKENCLRNQLFRKIYENQISLDNYI